MTRCPYCGSALPPLNQWRGNIVASTLEWVCAYCEKTVAVSTLLGYLKR